MIRCSPNTKQAKQNKCIQRNNTCKWSSIIWRSPDTKKAKQNKCI
ncbi:hypothetical protein ABH358_09435 [Staphylococcus aureus]|nr:hypothetical protein [Staphylococcus aureus]MDQ7122973.1 hypothetical protein [Staphylococcus aureus]MDQ7145832.1 hypothetical protein [Staphylococcus aureus]MDZ5796813.1 hypothetical protein [Staphylococcus aureus]MDZ7538152.1 hypothetical protein [Staphylococcus aureus]MEC6846004.1 hypothetical protein [Staphylococcus aureus]